uniref:Integrase core domain containing protein n=1 Tax=Solanum tuberosum TaxID=4113 RepID=M1BBA1_SOLTU
MAEIMTQLDILSKNVMGAGARSVNVVGVGCVNPYEAKFEALYNVKVNFLSNQGGGHRSNYPRQGGQSVQGVWKVQVSELIVQSASAHRRRDMTRTNLDMPPRKKARCIGINKGEENPPKKGRQDVPKGGKGKGKRHVSEAPDQNSDSEDPHTASSEPEEDLPLQSRWDEIRARSRPD